MFHLSDFSAKSENSNLTHCSSPPLIMSMGVLHNMKVKCDLFCQKNKGDLLCQENIFLNAR